MYLSAVILNSVIVTAAIVTAAGGELPCGEGDPGEHLAGIFCTAGSVAAFFSGDGVVHHRHDQLGIPLQTDNGELTQGHIESAAFAGDDQIVIKHPGDGPGNVQRCIFLALAVADIPDPGAEDHGVKNFYDSCWPVGVAAGRTVCFMQAGIAAIDVGAAVLAAKHGPLGKYCQAVKGCGTGVANGGVRQYPVVEGYIDAVMVTVEGNGFYINVCVQ